MAEQLGIGLNEDAAGLCPFHDDTDPSFQLRQDDDGVERWHCWPCGFGGDVYDLLMRKEGHTFPEALIRAEELLDALPPNWSPAFDLSKTKARKKETAKDWYPLLQEGRRMALSPQNDGMLCVVAGLVPDTYDETYRKAVDAFLRDTWRWAIDREGNILIPHFTAEDHVTGVKVRSLRGFKWSRDGSAYNQLYGVWHGRRHRNLLLCEGESDSVWASLQNPGVDVRGLPSGASTMREEYVRGTEEWELVFLAFDADSAGVDATREWLGELGSRARVCRLPRGHDLRSARPDLRQLIAEAITPTGVPSGIVVDGDSFVRLRREERRALTSWYAEPTARLIPADDDDNVDPALEVEVHYAGQVHTDVISSDDMASSAKMKRWAGKRSLDCLTGDSDVQLLQSFLTARAQVLPDVFQTARVGIHEPPSRYRYAGRSLVLPESSLGKLPWRYVGPAEIHGKVLLEDDGPIDWSWLDAVMQLNREEIIQPILAWLGATVRRAELQSFPILFVGGASGAGKSTIMGLLTRMFGSQLGGQLGAMTAFPLMRMLSSSTTLPVFIDEWTRQSREDTRLAFQGNVPIIYDGGIAERGRADQTVTQYRCTSPVCVAGEDTFSLDREQDRMIGVEVARAGQNVHALQNLGSAPLERFGYWFNRWAIENSDDLPPMPTGRYANRPEYNADVLRVGWATLVAFLEHAAHFDQHVPQLPREPDLSHALERRSEHENEYEALIREVLDTFDSNGHELAWVEPNVGTWVRFRAITSSDTMRKVEIALPGGSHAMRRYFEGRGHTIESRRVSLPFSKRTMFASLIHGFFPDDGNAGQ